ncbi:hypothetical protein ABZX77_17865 [Streptomyces sp. NPDC004237]|uniref:hypothetical protein n=1 Tax=Streptomyces sp. NPDC004237 TaxID=3154455 RepID=UPI0033A94BD6
MTREDHLAAALVAAHRAEKAADSAEHLARNTDKSDKAVALAAAGALWSDLARTHVCMADSLLSDPETED